MNRFRSLKNNPIVRSFHLHRSQPEDWVDASYWLVSTLFSGFMPVWLPVLLLTLFSRTPPLSAFTGNGEFALISASLISAAAYVVTKDSRWNFLRELIPSNSAGLRMNQAFPNQRLFIYLTRMLGFLASVIFMGALFAKMPEVDLTLNTSLVHTLSIGLVVLTMLISFVVTVVDNAFTNRPNIPELMRESFRDFEERFEELESNG